MFKNIIFSTLFFFLLTGCSSNMKTEKFIGQEPRFVLEEYFNGSTKAWGMFHDRFGNLKRQFVVDIFGTWEGNILTLDEHFEYSDGETDRRVWKITKLDENNYTGTAGDIIGKAKGTSYGNALNWNYIMDLVVGKQTLRVRFNDWMFLQPEGVLLNRAEISKWGIQLGIVTLSFSKLNSDSNKRLISQKQAAE
jgi:hypothetical protein